MKNLLIGKLLFICLFWWASMSESFGQLPKAISFEQLDSLQEREQRPVLVFIHTSWCRYCEAMEQSTFRNREVKKLLEEAFYFITLDAEAKEEIPLKGKTFRYLPNGNGTGEHELAVALGTIEGTLSFPTLCFLNADYEIIYQAAGYLAAKDLLRLLEAAKHH